MIDRVKDVRHELAYSKGTAAGALAAAAWLRARGIQASGLWEVSICLAASGPDTRDTQLELSINSLEWGLFFRHQQRSSWLRVIDIPFVHERDDFELLDTLPALRDLGSLVQSLEERCRITFARKHAAVRTALPDAEDVIRIWVTAAL
jgi:hypothetical protein